jgi:hypothetical protein
LQRHGNIGWFVQGYIEPLSKEIRDAIDQKYVLVINLENPKPTRLFGGHPI